MLTREIAEARLRAEGMRLTPQRRAVIEALVDNRTHPLAEEIAEAVCARVPGISLSTVYKTLRELADMGLILRLDLPDAMRFDPDTTHHGHLVCSSCGTVVDVAVPADVARTLADAAIASGAAPSHVDVVMRGRCAACSKPPATC